jgi:iron complex outermembrane receptor protein
MGNYRVWSKFSLVLAVLAFVPAALAQRTDENVTTQSEDAFGRSVGTEQLGIYSQGEVRGFSPIDAGNTRIEGLYFDRQTDISNRLVSGSSIRVGIAAQSYPFPSPTGIVDFDVRRAGDEAVVSPVLLYGPFDSTGLELDVQLPVFRDRLGIALGADFYKNDYPWGGKNDSRSFAIVPRWRPTPNIEILPFYSRITFRSEEPQQLMFTAEDVLPPKFKRNRYFGQDWAQSAGKTYTYGFIGQAHAGGWAVRLGVFKSIFAPSAQFADLYTGIDTGDTANEEVVVFPESRFESRSGELRVSRSFDAGDLRHMLYFSARGRVQQRRYGGEQVVDVGLVPLGVGRQVDLPDLEFGPQTRDEVRQGTLGLAYGLRWKNRGEISVGAQKTHYSKEVDAPGLMLPTSRDAPLLPNATATLYATSHFDVYASYTEGLEESPLAPNNAVNRNSAAPALRTKQYDGGIRWTLRPDLKLIAGVFSLEKTYFDLDTNQVFTAVGNVRHRGVELSLAGQPVRNLTLVAGARYLDAQLSGEQVDSGLIGRHPVGSYTWHTIGSADYALPGTGLSFDLMYESITRQFANSANTMRVPSRSVLHVGGRYRFKIHDKPVTLRAQLANIFDAYGWNVISGSAYTYNAPRRLVLYLASDL